MTQRERDTIIHLVAGGAIQWIPTCSLLVSLIDGTRKTISENCFQPAGMQYSNTPDGHYCECQNCSSAKTPVTEIASRQALAFGRGVMDRMRLVIKIDRANPKRTAGTVGAVLTCPLEVVKTRLQSSSSFVSPPRLPEAPGCTNQSEALLRPEQRRKLCTTILRKRPQPQIMAISHCGISSTVKSMSIVQCLKHIVQNEGPRALFKGLGPNLVGVAPSRAIYFCTYSQTKSMLNSLGFIRPDSPMVHILSASCAGFAASSATNPIWFVKTRLQLDYNSKVQMTVRECIGRIYAQGGFLGFYKGITASYVGISETVVHFVIYEAIKSKLVELHGSNHPGDLKTSRDFLEFMLAGATSKTIASCIAYPHEVARTRLREEGNKYNKFWQTLHTVWKEEGRAGLYRGLATQLVRQIPNTAIMMATYEAVVYVLTRRFNSGFLDAEEQPRICDLVDL